MINWIKDRMTVRQKQAITDVLYVPVVIRDVVFCWWVGLRRGKCWRLYGLPLIRSRHSGSIQIGSHFTSVSRSRNNTIGVIQPVIIRTLTPVARIVIGDNVGVSGATIAAKELITIGDNVLIGSGCIITDSDAHAVDYDARMAHAATATAPVHIGEGAFIGARSIIMKGVTVGARSVIGAGSVVTRDIPANCIAAGNPAKQIRNINA